jgi:hypothetical protein
MKTLVSLDTNIIVDDSKLSSIYFSSLQEFIGASESFCFNITETVLDESVQKYIEYLTEYVKVIADARSKLIRKKMVDDLSEYKVDLKKEREGYLSFLLKKNNLKAKEYVPLEASISVLQQRAIRKIPPFKGDKGFRDGLIWFSLLNYCKKNNFTHLIFITNDRNDFYNSAHNDLNEVLIKDSEKFGVKVSLFLSIKKFVEEHYPYKDVSKEVKGYDLINKVDFSKLLSDRISNENYDNMYSEVLDKFRRKYDLEFKFLENLIPKHILKPNSGDKLLILEVTGKVFFDMIYVNLEGGVYTEADVRKNEPFLLDMDVEIKLDNEGKPIESKLIRVNYEENYFMKNLPPS